ncbi:H+/nucleoside cotransporter [Acephala macrosclerotiorum]|nr:H+/nucleoside cotransporter [Acephala macrosclerotiorum]
MSYQKNLNEDGISISENDSNTFASENVRRGFSQRSRKNRIIDRSRNEYAAYFKHFKRPSTAHSVRSFFTSKQEAPKLDVYELGPASYQNGPTDSPPSENDAASQKSASSFRGSKTIIVHFCLGLLFTGWWIASLILHRGDKNWVVPLLLWMAIMFRLVTFYTGSRFLTTPVHFVWRSTALNVTSLIPSRLRLPISAAFMIAVIVIGAMLSEEFEDNTRVNRAVSLSGIGVCLFLLWLTSRNRRLINWHTIIVGMLMQFVIALFVLRTAVGFNIFSFLSQLCREFLGFADNGLAFLTDATVPTLTWFAISIIPPIIFFAGVAQLLSYWQVQLVRGVLPWFVKKSATLFNWALQVSGVEAVVASTSPFLGQGEAVMLIRPFIPYITNAELHQVMCSGFATIAGSVLVTYINLGINGHALISSCVMSIPASLVVSKLRYPEEDETSSYVVISDIRKHDGVNFVHAFTNGVWLGLKIAGIVIAILASVIAFIALLDGLLTWWGEYINIGPETPLTLELIASYLLYPVAFMLGVPRNGDLLKVARLIGVKILKNEFAAYEELQTNPTYATMSSRSRLIATYSLCGFGNIGAMGTQIGLMSQMAPERSEDIARVAGSALITGIISTLLSASMAGVLITDQAVLFLAPTSNSTVPAATLALS